jgi:hypothetical protein
LKPCPQSSSGGGQPFTHSPPLSKVFATTSVLFLSGKKPFCLWREIRPQKNATLNWPARGAVTVDNSSNCRRLFIYGDRGVRLWPIAVNRTAKRSAAG